MNLFQQAAKQLGMFSKTYLQDPRYFQIVSLTGLILYGWLWLDLGIRIEYAFIIIPTAILSQYLLTRYFKLPFFDPKSALTSSLSLILLLRTDLWYLAALAPVITIASKFLIRSKTRHFLNPTNFGLVAMMILFDGVWVSPGQWGNVAFFGFLILCAGATVVYRSERTDVTYAFLFSFAVLLFGRALWLGDPLTIPFHQMQNGALLIFTFFMISDPKTTPNSRAGRILFAALVAIGAFGIQFGLYRNNGLLWSLVFFCTLTPLIDRLFPGKQYEWSSRRSLLTKRPTALNRAKSQIKGVNHETDSKNAIPADVGLSATGAVAGIRNQPASSGFLRFLRS